MEVPSLPVTGASAGHFSRSFNNSSEESTRDWLHRGVMPAFRLLSNHLDGKQWLLRGYDYVWGQRVLRDLTRAKLFHFRQVFQ